MFGSIELQFTTVSIYMDSLVKAHSNMVALLTQKALI